MPNSENKVQFNLHNVHYALLNGDTYGTPVHVPGAVSLALEAQGDMSKFYADGIAYYVSNTNLGYAGDLEMAKFPDKMLQEVWGFTLGSSSKVLTEMSNVEAAVFALLFQIDGDANNELYCLYGCTGTRPNIGSATTEDTTKPTTQKSSISSTPMADGRVFSRTTKDTPANVRDNWFKSVFTETSAPAES